MGKIVRLAGVAGALALVACGRGDGSMNEDLKKDLERAWTPSELTMPVSQPGTQVVSAIERSVPPAPRRFASSQRAPKHRPAPRSLPAPVEAERSDAAASAEPQSAEVAPVPAEVASLPSPRPQPVVLAGGGGGEGAGSGRADGIGMGTIIGVVLRGGIVHGDECDPRTDGRRRGPVHTAVNDRIPVVGTFPGSGRVGSAATIGEMVLRGRTRF